VSGDGFTEHTRGFLQIGSDLPLRTDGRVSVLDEEINVHGQRLFDMDIVLGTLARCTTTATVSTNLEERQEEIQLLLRGPTVKTVPARIQKRANQADAEEIVRQVQHVNLPGDWGAAFYK